MKNRCEIVKLGGSLFRYSRDILRFLSHFAKEHALKIVVVPGGGPFASFIRKISFENEVSDDAAHWMAVLAMHQYAFFFSDASEAIIVERIEDVKRHSGSEEKRGVRGGCYVFLPFRLLREDDVLEHSWSVSSDTIAAFVAMKFCARRFVKLTDVDGIYDRNQRVIRRIRAEEIIKRKLFGCIDEALPSFIIQNRMKCVVVNGKHTERVKKVLLGEETISTEILP